MAKIRWRLGEMPTGRYKSFSNRAWPSAYYSGTGRAAVRLCSDIGYSASRVKNQQHGPIDIYIAVYAKTEEARRERGAFSWWKMSKPAETLEEAKRRAQEYLDENPQIVQGAQLYHDMEENRTKG